MFNRVWKSASFRIRRASSRIRRLIERPLLIEPRFVIVGTGRSGTSYISSLLTAGGIRCGHEGWWSPLDRRQPRLVGDSSWCATFELDDYDGRVFHQIRDPILTMRSVAALEISPHRRQNPWYQYRTQFVEYTGDPIFDALLTVDRRLVKSEEIAEWTWRLEDVDVDLVAEIGARLGRVVDRDGVQMALDSAPRNKMESKKQTTYHFSWSDLPDVPAKQRVLGIAESYRYL